MSTFLNNWLLGRMMSAPRGGEDKVWERVQYITYSQHGARIDLGVSPTANMNVEMHLRDFDPFATGGFLLGGKIDSATAKFYLWANNNGSVAYLRAGYGNSPNRDNNILYWESRTFASDTVLERRGAEIWLDGTQIGTSSGTFTADQNAMLCVGDTAYGDGCYNAKYDEIIVRSEYGSTILAHFIPVKILQSGPTDQLGRTIAVGAGCYYDLVTKQFYAEYYGHDFVAGPAVPKEYIWFVDPAVEAICVANWSSDGIGLTMQDAAAVTDVSHMLQNNTSATSFNEFQYFIGLEQGQYKSQYFANGSSLQQITLPTNIEWLFSSMFTGSSISSLTLPASVVGLGYVSLQNTSSLNTLICLPTTPPTVGSNALRNLGNSNTKIYVPNGYGNTYKAASGWSSYSSRIFELCADGTVPIEFADSAVEAICVANWSSDGSHLSKTDAAAVTNSQLGNTFQDNTQITSFYELEYFTGLTEIPTSAFRSSSVTGITIPENVTKCAAFTFANAASLATVILRPTTPPTYNYYTLGGNAAGLKIYVPYSADHSILAAYQAASGWSSWANIMYELNPDGTIPS